VSGRAASYGQDKKEGAKKKGAEAAQTKGKSKSSEVPANQRCQATTQDGDQCKRKAEDGGKLCWQHANMQKKGTAKAKKS